MAHSAAAATPPDNASCLHQDREARLAAIDGGVNEAKDKEAGGKTHCGDRPRQAGENTQHAGDVAHGPSPCPGGAHSNGALKADGSAHETEDHEWPVVGGERRARGGGQPQ